MTAHTDHPVAWRDWLILSAWVFSGLTLGGLALFAVEGPRAAGLARAAQNALSRNGVIAEVRPVAERWNQAGVDALRAYRFSAGQGKIALYLTVAGGIYAWRYAFFGSKDQLIDDRPLDAAAIAASARVPQSLGRLYAAGAWTSVPKVRAP